MNLVVKSSSRVFLCERALLVEEEEDEEEAEEGGCEEVWVDRALRVEEVGKCARGV